MLPNLNDLRYFQEICETKNISRAAERLGVTQPSLSIALKRLEDCFDAQLIVRSKSGVQLTAAGSRLKLQSSKLIEQWSQLRSDVQNTKTKVQGLYRVGVHPSVARYTMPKVLSKALDENPELEINLHHDLSRKVTEQVISYGLDFGLVMNPTKHDDLVIREILKDEVMLWTAGKPSDLQKPGNGKSVLIYDPGLVQSQSLIRTLNKRGDTVSRELHSNNLEVIVRLTAAGAGIGILPSRIARLLTISSLKPLPKSPSYKDQLCLVYRADQPKTVATQYLRQLFLSLKS